MSVIKKLLIEVKLNLLTSEKGQECIKFDSQIIIESKRSQKSVFTVQSLSPKRVELGNWAVIGIESNLQSKKCC